MSEYQSPSLPTNNLNNGDKILDPHGTIWEWNSKKREWLNKGQIETQPVVTESQDGLITPATQRTLELLQELVDQGYDFHKFKLQTDVESPYYYYFHSSDDLIRFIPEGPSRLRIEVDRARLYQKLMRTCCIGPKGAKGATGPAGRSGIAAANETFKTPQSTENATIIIDDIVNTPIDTPISLRIYDDNKEQVAEFTIPLNGDEVEIDLEDGYDLDEDEIRVNFELTSDRLTATIPFIGYTNTAIDNWTYKARQHGPDGLPGNDGDTFIEIINSLLPDSSVYSNKALVSMRKSGSNNVTYLEKSMFDKIIVSGLSSSEGALNADDVLNVKYASAEMTTRSNKDICFYDISKNFENITVPSLDLPQWTPADGCGQRSRWSAFRYNWWDFTETNYMFRIVPSPKPPSACCEADMFYCPNVGDNPCGVTGSFGRTPTLEMPKKFEGECFCECEDPIEFELQSGGYYFDPIDTTIAGFEANSYIMRQADSVLNGSADRYIADILINQPVRIEVKIQPRSEVCGGEAVERSSCAFKDGKKIHTTAMLQDLSGNAVFTSPQVTESESFPASIDFRVTTPIFTVDGVEDHFEDRIRAIITVNDTFVNLCRGYRIIVAVFKDR